MNIESYIIAFLKKNKYINLPGIGNFKSKKDKNSDTQIEFSPVSIIDDLFASFIGVNENVSTINASNAITQYSKDLKNKLKAGEEVTIPGLGSLKMGSNGIHFKQEHSDTLLTPTENKHYRELNFGSSQHKPIEIEVPQSMEENYQNRHSDPNIDFKTETYNPAYDVEKQAEQAEKKQRQAKVSKQLLTTILLLAVIGILIWAFWKFLGSSNDSTPVATVTQENEVQNEGATGMTSDSTNTDSTATLSTGPSLKIAVKTYDSQVSADKRQKQLESYGWQVGQKDDPAKSEYVIYVEVPKDGRSPESVVDSIKGVLNPGGNVQLIN